MKKEDESQRPMRTLRNKFMAHRHTKYSTSGAKMGKIKTSKKSRKFKRGKKNKR